MRQFTLILLLILLAFQTFAQVNDLTNSLNRFSYNLYEQVKEDTSNLFISPLSVYSALLMLYAGANKETKKEFEQVFHIQNKKTVNTTNLFIKSLTKWRDKTNFIKITNAVWIQENLALHQAYQNHITQNYNSELRSVNFMQKDKAVQLIKEWTKAQTNGRISNSIKENDLNKDTKLILSNAIYFIGKWSAEFDKDLTKADVFYSADKKTEKIEFMHKKEYLDYYENNNFQFISKTYEGFDKSFCIILPKKRYGLKAVEGKLLNSTLESIFDKTSCRQVKFSIRKFKLESNYQLKEALIKLGLKKTFSPAADFSGIAVDEPIMLNYFKHQTFIEINEEKTEAAAVSTIGTLAGFAGRKKLKSKIFKADHPFIFMIVDTKTKAIIFIGRYVQAKSLRY